MPSMGVMGIRSILQSIFFSWLSCCGVSIPCYAFTIGLVLLGFLIDTFPLLSFPFLSFGLSFNGFLSFLFFATTPSFLAHRVLPFDFDLSFFKAGFDGMDSGRRPRQPNPRQFCASSSPLNCLLSAAFGSLTSFSFLLFQLGLVVIRLDLEWKLLA
jgi:hypothetical protein